MQVAAGGLHAKDKLFRKMSWSKQKVRLPDAQKESRSAAASAAHSKRTVRGLSAKPPASCAHAPVRTAAVLATLVHAIQIAVGT